MMSTFLRTVLMSLCVFAIAHFASCGKQPSNSPSDENNDKDCESGCDNESGQESGGDSDGDVDVCEGDLLDEISEEGVIAVTTDNNYSFKMQMDIELTEVKDGEDLQFEWGEVRKDFYGKTVKPLDDIEMVLLSLWNNTPEDLAKRIDVDDLPRDENLGAISTFPEGKFTKQTLYNFDSFGSEVEEGLIDRIFDMDDPEFDYDPETHTFLVMAASSRDPGKESRMLGFFKLNPDESNTTVTLHDKSATMDLEVQLPPNDEIVPVPTGTPDLTFSWEGMVDLWNSLGNEWIKAQINEVAIARYEEMTLDDLKEDFLVYEDEADDWWEGEVTLGDSIELSSETIGLKGCERDEDDLVVNDKDRFPGFEDDGATWILYTFCTVTCNNPAPWSITIVHPCDN